MFPSKRITIPVLGALSLVLAAQTCPNGPVEAPTPTPALIACDSWTTVILDQDHTSGGLHLDTGGDVDVEPVETGIPPEYAMSTGNGEIVYDGQMGEPDSAAPTVLLGGGSIAFH